MESLALHRKLLRGRILLLRQLLNKRLLVSWTRWRQHARLQLKPTRKGSFESKIPLPKAVTNLSTRTASSTHASTEKKAVAAIQGTHSAQRLPSSGLSSGLHTPTSLFAQLRSNFAEKAASPHGPSGRRLKEQVAVVSSVSALKFTKAPPFSLTNVLSPAERLLKSKRV